MEAAVERKTTCWNEPYDETLVVEMNRPNRVRRGRAVAFAGSGKTETVNSLPPSLQTTLTARPFSVAPKTSLNPRNSQFFPQPHHYTCRERAGELGAILLQCPQPVIGCFPSAQVSVAGLSAAWRYSGTGSSTSRISACLHYTLANGRSTDPPG